MCVLAKSLQLCLTLCDPVDCSLPDPSVHGILQAPIQEWVAMPSSKGSSQSRDQTASLPSPALAGGFFTTELPGKPKRMFSLLCLVAQSCMTFCDPMDCSLPGSFVHGILQTRILEWVAMPSSWASSQPRDRTCVSCIDRQVLYH